MPELPEVETIRRQLRANIKGKKIAGVKVLYPKVIKPLSPSQFEKKVRGATIKNVGRRAKLLLFHLSNGNTMVVHLKLTGRLIIHPAGDKPNSSTEVIFVLKTLLFYDDLRRFGFIKVIPTKSLKTFFQKEKFGPEPLDKDFTLEKFKSLLALKAQPRQRRDGAGPFIKPLLMDQTFISGVGNIYSQEACFCAKIAPVRRASTLKENEIQDLYRCLKKVLREAIKHHGSSVDTYVDLFGREGRFVPRLKVYGRGGKRCLRCSATLKEAKIAGRGTVWCPKCQY